MVTNNTLKEYYINLHKMYNQAVTMLTALNQSLTTNGAEVTVSLIDDDNTSTEIRLPSFLYLENKLEQISNTIDNLFSLPKTGEAWFQNDGSMFKLNLLQSNTAPIIPTLNNSNIYASTIDNNILKDMVSPKTYLKVDISNLPNNINQLYMRKYVLFDNSIFNSISSCTTYEDVEALLYNFTNGIEYEVYESVLNLPIKHDEYKSKFLITAFATQDENYNTLESNPWLDKTTNTNVSIQRYSYRLTLDTLNYTAYEDSSLVYILNVGDYLALNNEYAIYRVKSVDYATNTVTIEEYLGHQALTTFTNNSEMYFTIYNGGAYSKYKYVEIPLEENPYICICLCTINNNIRSSYSAPLAVNLNNIYMYDKYGNAILDSYGKQVNYIDYYKKYCTNIGDLILGLTEEAYPQLSNFTPTQIEELQNPENVIISSHINNTISATEIKVLPINKHLTEDTYITEIKNLHNQKNNLNNQLSVLNSNISSVYTKLVNTDFSQELTITQESLKAQLNDYYTEKETITNQLASIISNITSTSEYLVTDADVKYRIRAVFNTTELEDYLHETYGDKCDIISIDAEYKYKSTTTDTETLSVIDGNTFTDWNKYTPGDKERELVFNDTISAYRLQYKDYVTTENIIKWNQIDIPIKQGEEVVLRIRYKYNIGQPFINMYTPWSDETTVIFPEEYKEDLSIRNILESNANDSITSSFNTTLINDGYQKHVTDSIIDGQAEFFHSAEHIYSGFTNSTNNLISLKDKLAAMTDIINEYKSKIDTELNSKFTVHLKYDDNMVELFTNTVNKINLYNTNKALDTYVSKSMNIIIKNTGSTILNLYSLFPGSIDTPLIATDVDSYSHHILNYERVPICVAGKLHPQHLGQWIYFRQNNPYSKSSIYYTTDIQNNRDASGVIKDSIDFIGSYEKYLPVDNSQILLGYRYRSNNIVFDKYTWKGIYKDYNWEPEKQSEDSYLNAYSILGIDGKDDNRLLASEYYAKKDINFFMYEQLDKESNTYFNQSYNENNYIMKYSDVKGLKVDEDDVTTTVYLDNKTALKTFIEKYNPFNFNQEEDFIGAFLYPNVEAINVIANVSTSTDKYNTKYLNPGESISIPIEFEYYLDGYYKNDITKSLYFDIKNSLFTDPLHYMLEITANYNETATNNILNTNIESMVDDATT